MRCHLFMALPSCNFTGRHPSSSGSFPRFLPRRPLPPSPRLVSRALCIAGDGQSSGGAASSGGGLLGFPGSSSHSKGTLPLAGRYTLDECPSSSLPPAPCRRPAGDVAAAAALSIAFLPSVLLCSIHFTFFLASFSSGVLS
ncbi:Os02g0461600 [Oryza sativa Japonica Group]|uniref:Os02g0461600 protein n=1 Tax=Oryza sativa subsp. japonica TaxID=39947 RepID=A0A0N7KF90_ORYSJ|nr:hypothetical protein EE612_011173 [Oryza sativa]BAS78553.1 Os02g0461600 [Oryza sativa Japonica Group]